MPLGLNGNGSVTGLATGANGVGKVLQVVTASIPISAGYSVTVNSSAATTLSASITPLSAGSTIIVTVDAAADLISSGYAAVGSMYGYYHVRRGTTAGSDRQFGYYSPAGTMAVFSACFGGSYVFPANSTAASTFTLYAHKAGAMNMYIQEARMQIMEIAA